MRAFTAAAVQVAPLPGPLTAESIKGEPGQGRRMRCRCVESTGAELVVLPESVTTGFTPGTGPDELLPDPASEVPGPVVEPLQETPPAGWACTSSVGTYERGAERGRRPQRVGPGRPATARSPGVYRKTHPFCTEMRSPAAAGSPRATR